MKRLLMLALTGAILPIAYGQKTDCAPPSNPAYATVDLTPRKAKKPPASKDPDRILHYYGLRTHTVGDSRFMYHDVEKHGTIRITDKHGDIYYVVDEKVWYKETDDPDDGQIQDDDFTIVQIVVHSKTKDYTYFISDGALPNPNY